MSTGEAKGPVMSTGEAKGGVTLQSSGWMQPRDALKFYPEIQAQLDDITRRGWKYLYITTTGTALAELTLEKSTFRISVRPTGPRGSGGKYLLELDIGAQAPTITAIPEIKEFRVNVCSKNLPRAATADLSKGIVTYIDDPFWRWERGWESDKKKLSDAREVQEIASWLLDIKGYKLIEAFKLERYQELSKLFKEMPA